MGPQLPEIKSNALMKKRRVLRHEKLYVSAFPKSPRYSKSLMHKEPLSFVLFTPITDFLITTSDDGVVKFWKKTIDSIEFVKQYKSHAAEIISISVSADGRSLATAALDNLVKIFDVESFDLIAILQIEYTPKTVSWVHKKGASVPLLAVSEASKPFIHIYDTRDAESSKKPIHTIKTLHKKPVSVIVYNEPYNCVVSADDGGMLEYWRPDGAYEKPDNVFKLKSATSLFDFKKSKSFPTSLTLSPTGSHFATFSLPDRQVRIFEFATGKLYRAYNECLTIAEDLHHTKSAPIELTEVEFGRRIALERDVESESVRRRANVIFDESGKFIFLGTIWGIKVINTVTNEVVKWYGKDENFRAIGLTLYQGQRRKQEITTVAMAAANNPLLQEGESIEPILVATAVGKVRFYMFTNQENISKPARDVQNERPRVMGGSEQPALVKTEIGTRAIIHTTYGDIQLRLFPDAAPKAVENFVTHSRHGYYNSTIFHRVIRKFMIQGGDPLGDGTGGESIWNMEFADEFSSLKHDKPYTVSMANAGPNTNRSQFFITTEKTPWLDNKHTIFGRVTQGFDVIHKIENARTYKERPVEDIKIMNIDVE